MKKLLIVFGFFTWVCTYTGAWHVIPTVWFGFFICFTLYAVWQSLTVFVKPSSSQTEASDPLDRLNKLYREKLRRIRRSHLRDTEREYMEDELSDWYAEESQKIL